MKATNPGAPLKNELDGTLSDPKTPKNNKPTKTPQNRGGARGKSRNRKPLDQEKTPPEGKPELICRVIRNQWRILLALPHDKIADIFQGESQLSPNGNGEHPLENFTAGVQWAENDKAETIELFDGTSSLIFKLRKNWEGDGRKVKHISSGFYVVFAPCDWQRTGEAPVESSECSDNKFLAHYFFSEGNDELDGFIECDSFFSSKRFSLEGKKVVDDSDMGDLYVADVPRLNDTKNWQDVSWVRTGEEGGRKWGENFEPKTKTLATVLAD